MTNGAPARSSTSSTTSATEKRLGRSERVDEIMKFVDTQGMVRKYAPGWFGEVETELRKNEAHEDDGVHRLPPTEHPHRATWFDTITSVVVDR